MPRVPSLALVLVSALLWSAPGPVHALTQTQYCQNFGTLTESIVAARDDGVPPSEILQMAEKAHADGTSRIHAQMNALRRWMILFVYDMSALDAAWIRQRVETKCLQQTFR